MCFFFFGEEKKHLQKFVKDQGFDFMKFHQKVHELREVHELSGETS
jgi:hypothetical protein